MPFDITNEEYVAVLETEKETLLRHYFKHGRRLLFLS